MNDQINAPSSSASDVATVQEWIKRTRLSYKSHGPADAMERILIRTTVTAATLRSLLDNLVIAQGLSREIRTQATAEARSYLFNTRQAAPAPSSLAGGISREEVVAIVRQFASPSWCSVDRLVDTLLAALSPEAPAREGVVKACADFQEAIDYFEADVADALAEDSERADLWDREVTVNIDALKTVMSAALTPRHEAPASEGGAS